MIAVTCNCSGYKLKEEILRYLEEKEINPEILVNPLKNVVRIATPKDTKIHEKNIQDSTKALTTAKKIASDLNLNKPFVKTSLIFLVTVS